MGGEGFEPPGPLRVKQEECVPNPLPRLALVDLDIAGCSNGCSEAPETGHNDRMESLARVLRNLTPEERLALTRILELT